MYTTLIIEILILIATLTPIFSSTPTDSHYTTSSPNSPKGKNIKQLVQFVLANTRYYYDYRAITLEIEIEKYYIYIQQQIENAANNDPRKVQMYLTTQTKVVEFLKRIVLLRGTCGIKGLLVSVGPKLIADIHNTGDAELIKRFNKISQLTAIDEEFDIKHLQQVYDRLEKFLNGNADSERAYEQMLEEIVKERCGGIICP